MYEEYLKYINIININNIKTINFKSNKSYNGILEHVSYELGLTYLSLIETDFKDIDKTILKNF